MAMFLGMFQKVDGVRLQVPNLEDGLRFYQECLGHELLWRRGSTEIGLRMPNSDTELVLFTETVDSPKGNPEVDLLVESADAAVRRIRDLGGRTVKDAFDIPVGRCAVVDDPFGNRLVILDLSKGLQRTDPEGHVIE